MFYKICLYQISNIFLQIASLNVLLNICDTFISKLGFIAYIYQLKIIYLQTNALKYL